MSQSTTSGGGRVTRRVAAICRISPPWRRLWRMVARRSASGPVGSGRRRRVRFSSSGSTSLRISAFAAAMSAALIASKSIVCRRSRSETVSVMSTCCSSAGRAAARARRLRGFREPPRPGRRALGRRRAPAEHLQRRRRLRRLRVAPEHVEGVVEQLARARGGGSGWRRAPCAPARGCRYRPASAPPAPPASPAARPAGRRGAAGGRSA